MKLSIPLYELFHLYFSGKRIYTKVSFQSFDGLIRVYIQDAEHVTFKAALEHLKDIAQRTMTGFSEAELNEMRVKGVII